jgi:hypothetical protein
MNELLDALSRDDQTNIWDYAGKRELDESVAVVADYYIQYKSERATIREELREFESLWSLVLFVRRAGVRIKTDAGSREDWFNRGLATASMIDANCDYRDLIVSLVVLRSFAIDAGLDTDQAFDRAIDWSTERMHGILTNARNHDRESINQTVAAFGPSPFTLNGCDNNPIDRSGGSAAS